MPPFLKLLRDSEAEVRVAAASKVACIGNILDTDTVRACARAGSRCPDGCIRRKAAGRCGKSVFLLS